MPIYRSAIAPEWIDYNGHLRDAYYTLIFSHAIDALMDWLGMDAGYRGRTRNTLYTLEMHVHYLREVHASDAVRISAHRLGSDHKRLHLGLELACEGREGIAASAEFMLLHVHQGDTVSAFAFPPEITAAIERFGRSGGDGSWSGPGSRRIELRGR